MGVSISPTISWKIILFSVYPISVTFVVSYIFPCTFKNDKAIVQKLVLKRSWLNKLIKTIQGNVYKFQDSLKELVWGFQTSIFEDSKIPWELGLRIPNKNFWGFQDSLRIRFEDSQTRNMRIPRFPRMVVQDSKEDSKRIPGFPENGCSGFQLRIHDSLRILGAQRHTESPTPVIWGAELPSESL